MKRYAVFAFEAYEAFGGWRDFIASFDTAEDAVANSKMLLGQKRCGVDYVHTVDLTTGEMIFDGAYND